jgi:hypothetical protein
VVDFGKEADLRRGHGVVVWKEELEFEDAAYIATRQPIRRFGVTRVSQYTYLRMETARDHQ